MPNQVRKTLLRVIGEADKASAKEVHSAMSLTKPKVRRRKRGARRNLVTLKPVRHDNGKLSHFVDKQGLKYYPYRNTDGNPPRAGREDGAVFQLRKDGKWVHIIPRSGIGASSSSTATMSAD